MAHHPTSSSVLLFQQLFGNFPSHSALLDLEGQIIAVNRSWNDFGRKNGLANGYSFEGQNYLAVCENAASQCRYAVEAMIGLLDVMKAGRPTFSMVYPCHSPSEKQWYRLWIELQLPHSPSVIVAHTRLKDYFDESDTESESIRPLMGVPFELLNQPMNLRLHR